MSDQHSRTGQGHVYVRTPRRIRPRFSRSKLGCLACRIRKKKCDEQKPCCKACKKQQLICSWPNDESESTGSVGFAWQINLKAGARVSKVPMAVANSEAAALAYESSVTVEKEPPKRHKEVAGTMLIEMGLTGMFVQSQELPYFALLLEHYVKNTSDILIGRKISNNPFLSSALAVAYSDTLVMHSLLAVSGIHYQHSNQNRDVRTAVYKHYGIVLKGFKYSLTHWVAGASAEQTIHLFLVAIMMCMYEALGGNENGSISQHVRAAREFALPLVTGGLTKQEPELAGILFEAYAYFALLSHFERRSLPGPSHEEDPILSALDQIRHYRTFGSFLGCAYRLYEFIPSIARLVLYEKRSISGNDDPNIRDLYENLRWSVAHWSTDEECGTTLEDNAPSQSSEEMAGMIVQNALLMLLHDCRIKEGQGPGDVMQDIQPLIDDTMSLFNLINADPTGNVIVWAMLITGSMMQMKSQRQSLVQTMLTHHTHTALSERVSRLLQWIWEDDDESTYGIAGLEKVARQHKTPLCFT